MKSQSGERISVSSAAKDSRDVVRRAEDLCRHQGGSRTEHCGHSRGNATTGVIQKHRERWDVPLLQYIDTTIDVPVAKRRREDTTENSTRTA